MLIRLFLAMAATGLCLPGCQSPQKRHDPTSSASFTEDHSHQQRFTDREFHGELIDEEIVDLPVKAAVYRNMLVSGAMSEESLRSLLLEQFESARRKRGFTFYAAPTQVGIYVFTSREHLESPGSWIAMLFWDDGSEPRVSVKESALENLAAQPTTHFGLAEAERRQVFKELAWAEDRAMREADRRVPLAEVDRNIDEFQKLLQRYKAEIRRKYGLTEEECAKIVIEGFRKNWPAPPYGGDR